MNRLDRIIARLIEPYCRVEETARRVVSSFRDWAEPDRRTYGEDS